MSDMENHPNVVAVQDALVAAGAQKSQVIVLDDAVHTAAAAAEALGVEVGQIANSLIFDADGEPLLVLTSGAHRVDTALQAYDSIWAAGGVPRAVFPITYAELLRVTAGTPAEVA